jgi:hypothetical protein
MGDKSPRPTCQWTNRCDNDLGTKALTRSSVHKSTGMDAIPGTRVVWNSSGHYNLTQMSVYFAKQGMASIGLKGLPPELLELVSWIAGIEMDVVLQDVTWANVVGEFGYNPKGGQILHFMKDVGQDNLAAYKLSLNLILTQGSKAAKGFRLNYVFMKSHSTMYKILGPPAPDLIKDHLAPALHTLQDSFSPGHTRRWREDDVIEEIFAWDEENKYTHDKNDAEWKDTHLGQAASLASGALIKCCVLAALDSDPLSAFLQLADVQVVKPYLETRFTAFG